MPKQLEVKLPPNEFIDEDVDIAPMRGRTITCGFEALRVNLPDGERSMPEILR